MCERRCAAWYLQAFCGRRGGGRAGGVNGDRDGNFDDDGKSVESTAAQHKLNKSCLR